jgi:hypothetical protein
VGVSMRVRRSMRRGYEMDECTFHGYLGVIGPRTRNCLSWDVARSFHFHHGECNVSRDDTVVSNVHLSFIQPIEAKQRHI